MPRVRASAAQAGKLLKWAAAWPRRTWVVEGAGGLGHLLAQQLVAAGERVLDVQPKLASRVRLLQGIRTRTAPATPCRRPPTALRSRTWRQVTAEDYPAVLKVWSKRHRDLARTRNQVACRLQACCASWSRRPSGRRSPQLTLPGSGAGLAVGCRRGGPRRTRRRGFPPAGSGKRRPEVGESPATWRAHCLSGPG
jgi:hypothetical protein